MKKHMKSKIRDLVFSNQKKKAIDTLKKRYTYLKSKLGKRDESNQMKYIKYHLTKLGAKI